MRAHKGWPVVSVVVAALAACTDSTTHILVGNSFNAAGSCLEVPSNGFDVVDGPEPGQCPPACVIDAKTGTVYVTVVCPPYPPLDTVEVPDATMGASDPCTGALAAWSTMTVCGADAGTDAGTDAAMDASSADAHAD
jgi:hypothetical protein